MGSREKHPVTRVAVALFNSQGEILLLKRLDGYYKGYWEVPGGKQILWEGAEETAFREVLEETGLRIRKGSLKPLFFLDAILRPHFHRVLLAFFAESGGRIPQVLKTPEHAGHSWFSKRALPLGKMTAHDRKIARAGFALFEEGKQ